MRAAAQPIVPYGCKCMVRERFCVLCVLGGAGGCQLLAAFLLASFSFASRPYAQRCSYRCRAVLDELRELWESKLDDSGAIAAPAPVQ